MIREQKVTKQIIKYFTAEVAEGAFYFRVVPAVEKGYSRMIREFFVKVGAIGDFV